MPAFTVENFLENDRSRCRSVGTPPRQQSPQENDAGWPTYAPKCDLGGETDDRRVPPGTVAAGLLHLLISSSILAGPRRIHES
jgi:hypothetical protein